MAKKYKRVMSREEKAHAVTERFNCYASLHDAIELLNKIDEGDRGLADDIIRLCEGLTLSPENVKNFVGMMDKVTCFCQWYLLAEYAARYVQEHSRKRYLFDTKDSLLRLYLMYRFEEGVTLEDTANEFNNYFNKKTLGEYFEKIDELIEKYSEEMREKMVSVHA